MKAAAPVLAALACLTGARAAAPPRPAEADRHVVGVLEEVDFIHRTGRFRTGPTGERVDFTLTPEAEVEYLRAGADLRHLPLGSAYAFTLHRDAAGRFTRASAVRARSASVPAAATARQRKRYAAFVKARGLPARVERTQGRTLTLSVFGGEPATSEETWPGDSSHPGHGVRVAVANDELRTWNPPVDHEWGKIVAFRKGPAGRHTLRLVVTVNHMLEGFRRGRYVRVFPDAWQLQDQPFGEQLFHYGAQAFPPELAENPAKEYPDQYPFRTDFGNAHLGWYRLRPGVAPPPDSEHRVFGTLLAVAADGRAGRFRPDNASDEVAFRLIPGATVRYLNAAADLATLPVGTRYCFHTYQDESGAFRRVSFVSDEVSDLIRNGALWRVESLDGAGGSVTAARQPPGVRNDQGDPEQPPDVGRALLRLGPDTRFWKGDKQVGRAALAVGDLLLVNRTGDRPGAPSRCTDVWIGAEAHKQLPHVGKKSSPSPPKGPPR